MKRRVAVTGARGLIGQFLTSELVSDYEVHSLDISDPVHSVDITDELSVLSALERIQPDTVIHLAAFTDVTAAWQQTDDKSGSAYMVNVTGTENVAKGAAQIGVHLIHLSTAFVFDGEKKTPYVETDEPSPIEWYGQTKAWAEEVVQRNARNWTILRIDQPFHHLPSATKPDLPHQIADRILDGSLPPQFTDHFFGPTYIPDLIRVCKTTLIKAQQGIFHATNNETWTNHQYARAVAMAIDADMTIQESSIEDYLKTANRPYQRNTSLDSTKLWGTLSETPTSVAEALSNLSLTK